MSPLPTYIELGIDPEGSRKAASCRCARWNNLSCFQRINQISQVVKISTIFFGLRVGHVNNAVPNPVTKVIKRVVLSHRNKASLTHENSN